MCKHDSYVLDSAYAELSLKVALITYQFIISFPLHSNFCKSFT
jgi:hypothetical protein